MEKETERKLPGITTQLFEVAVWRDNATGVFFLKAHSVTDDQGIDLFNPNFGKLLAEARKMMLQKYIALTYMVKASNGEITRSGETKAKAK